MTVKRNFRIRTHKRASVSIPLMVIIQGNAYEGHMRELSRGGALIESDENLSPGQPLTLGFRIKAIPEVIEVPVEIVYKNEAGPDPRIQRKYGYGMKFGTLDEGLAQKIDQWVKNERLFGDLAAALTEARRRRTGKDDD